MKKRLIIFLLMTLGLSACFSAERPASRPTDGPQPVVPAPTLPVAETLLTADWTRRARIVPLAGDPAEANVAIWAEQVDKAVASGANVILDWSCASDGWDCLSGAGLDAALEIIRQRADYVHTAYPGVRYIMYVAPLEAVTEGIDQDGDARVDPGQEARSLAWQHPDWAQVGLDGRAAIFYGSMPDMPFWVCQTCEDVWLSPAHPEFRRLTMEKAALLAASGLDGLWFDVPFLRDDFGADWQGQWPDVSPAARRLFQQQTGLSLPDSPFAPDWQDPVWQAFVAWRYRLIREFVGEYAQTVRAVNPHFRLIMETSAVPGPAVTQMAASPLDLPLVSDLTAHEVGGLERPAAYGRNLDFLARLLALRHIDLAFGHPSWLLSYVAAGYPETTSQALLHAGVVLGTGFNYYTSGDEGMTQTVDTAFQRQLFAWVAAHEEVLYPPDLQPYASLAVVYSQTTIDYRDRGRWETSERTDAFYGALALLLDQHIPFAVRSDRDLERLDAFQAVWLPQVEALSEAQAAALRDYVLAGGTLLVTGEEASLYDEWGNRRAGYALADLFGLDTGEADWQVYVQRVGRGRVVFTPINYAQAYYWALAPWDASGVESDLAEAADVRQAFWDEFWQAAATETGLMTDAPPEVRFVLFQRPDGLSLRLLNFSGLETANPRPAPVTAMQLRLRLPAAAQVQTVTQLDLLGETHPLPFVQDGDALRLQLDLNTPASWVEIRWVE